MDRKRVYTVADRYFYGAGLNSRLRKGFRGGVDFPSDGRALYVKLLVRRRYLSLCGACRTVYVNFFQKPCFFYLALGMTSFPN